MFQTILGNPGAVSGGLGKSKLREKIGEEKLERKRGESYQTSSKKLSECCLQIGQKRSIVFHLSHFESLSCDLTRRLFRMSETKKFQDPLGNFRLDQSEVSKIK